MDMPVFTAVDFSYKQHLPMYAITISPRARSAKDITKLYLCDTIYISRQLNKMSQHYCLYAEFDSVGRMHYHGILNIYNKTKIPNVVGVLNRLGFTKITKLDTFISHLRYLIYCQKEYASILSGRIFDIEGPIMYSSILNIKKKHELLCNKLPKRKLLLDYFSKEDSKINSKANI